MLKFHSTHPKKKKILQEKIFLNKERRDFFVCLIFFFDFDQSKALFFGASSERKERVLRKVKRRNSELREGLERIEAREKRERERKVKRR